MKERKQDHLRICAKEDVEKGSTGLEDVRLQHRCCPEADLDDLDTSVTFLGKTLRFPLIFEAMTGGTVEAMKINKALAKAAQKHGIGMGVGSQRAAIDDPKLARTFQVRDVAPDILLIGNLGAVQLNNGYGIKECDEAVKMIDADALALHLNPLQEAVQPEGNTNFKGLIGKINAVAKELGRPVIAKEVGSGLDFETAKRLAVQAYDCGGLGGTSWSIVESYRTDGAKKIVGQTYAEWGIPTAECVIQLSKLGKPLIASGGIRTGLDAAKSIALGADIAGCALPVLRAYYSSGQAGVEEFVERFEAEFRAAMYLTGSQKVSELRGKARNG